MRILSERLRALAAGLKLSNAEVARRAGLSERRYGHYVSGVREPDLATLVRIAKVLKSSPNELLGWDDPKSGGSKKDQLKRRLSSTADNLTTPHLEVLVTQAEALTKGKRKSIER